MARTKLILLSIFSVVVQFALAVLGWGGFVAFFSHPAIRAMTIATVGIATVAFFAGGNVSPGVKEDRGNRWVLKAFSGIAILAAFFSAYTDRIDFWTIDGDRTRWVGLAAFVAGSLLRVLPVFVLQDRFSGLVAIQKGHRLETRGLYSLIRNPSYLGLLISSVGWALVFRSGVGVLLALSLLVPLVARIRAEERLLREHFGAQYEKYCSRTWRLLPGIY